MIHLTTRTTRLVLVFFLATFASYCLLNLIPGDIIDVLLGETAGGTGDAREMMERNSASINRSSSGISTGWERR